MRYGNLEAFVTASDTGWYIRFNRHDAAVKYGFDWTVLKHHMAEEEANNLLPHVDKLLLQIAALEGEERRELLIAMGNLSKFLLQKEFPDSEKEVFYD
jgi:hypothetical protein